MGLAHCKGRVQITRRMKLAYQQNSQNLGKDREPTSGIGTQYVDNVRHNFTQRFARTSFCAVEWAGIHLYWENWLCKTSLQRLLERQ